MRLIIGVLLALAVLAGGYYGYNRFIAPSEAATRAGAPEAELARLAKSAAATPSAPLAGEADYAAFAEALGGFASVTYGAIEAGAAKDVVIAMKDDADIAMTIGELRLYGADAAALKKYAAGEADDSGARVAARLDATGVEWTGLDKLTDKWMSGYAGAMESALAAAVPEGEEAEPAPAIDLSVDISSYEMRMGRVVIDGFTLHPWTAPPPPAEDAPADAETASWKAMARSFMSMAAVGRVTSMDAFVANDLVMGMDYSQVAGKTSFTGAVPLIAARGIHRGDQDFVAMQDFSMDMRMETPRTESVMGENGEPVAEVVDGPPIVMDVKSGADLYVIEGVKLAKLYEYVAAGKAPPMSETDLLSLGVWRVKGERQGFGDTPFYTVRDTVMDLSRFHWLIPTDVRFSSEGIVYDIAGLMDWFGRNAVTDPAQQQAFTPFVDALKRVGLAEIRADFEMTATYAPAAGGSNGGMALDITDVSDLSIESASGFPSYARLRELAPADGEEMPLEAFIPALLAETTIAKYELTLTDHGGIAKSFAAAVEMAKLAPEEDASAAMLRDADPEDLRVSTAAMIRLSGSQAAASFPPAGDFATAVADFIQKGGELSIKINPPQPVSIADAQLALTSASTDPQALVDKFGLSVTHKPPRK